VSDLSDERIEEHAEGTGPTPTWKEAQAMAEEIRRRRAADLSEADIESLRWARIFAVKGATKGVNVSETERALKVLDRLIGGRDG
jgi:hypothetical protein